MPDHAVTLSQSQLQPRVEGKRGRPREGQGGPTAGPGVAPQLPLLRGAGAEKALQIPRSTGGRSTPRQPLSSRPF